MEKSEKEKEEGKEKEEEGVDEVEMDRLMALEYHQKAQVESYFMKVDFLCEPLCLNLLQNRIFRVLSPNRPYQELNGHTSGSFCNNTIEFLIYQYCKRVCK